VKKKVLCKFNFFVRFIGLFRKYEKKLFVIPIANYVNIIHQNHTAVLQLSYREIFIFLNIPGKDLTLSYSVTNFIPYKQIINNLKSYLGKFYFNALIKFGGIKKIIDAYGSNRDRIIKFTRSHLSAACREKNMDLCKEIIAFLNEGTTSTQNPDIHELDHIIHYTVENHHIFSKTALNYANQNNDRILGLELLQLEKQVHQDKNKGLSCIMETLDSGPLLSLIIQTYKDFFPDKTKLKTIGIAVWTFIKVGLFSFLPLLFDLYSDINLASDYRVIARFGFIFQIVTNETNCTSYVSSSAPSSCYFNDFLYNYAYGITWIIISVTLLLHLAIIIWYNEDDVSFLKNFLRVENKYAARVMVFFWKTLMAISTHLFGGEIQLCRKENRAD